MILVKSTRTVACKMNVIMITEYSHEKQKSVERSLIELSKPFILTANSRLEGWLEFLLHFFIDLSTNDAVHDTLHQYFPVLQFPCCYAFLPIPFLMLNQHAVDKIAPGLSVPAISCSVLKLLSQWARELHGFQHALHFDGEVPAVVRDDAARFGHNTHFSQSHLTPNSFMCSWKPQLIFLPAVEWRPWWAWA